jgi:Gene product 88
MGWLRQGNSNLRRDGIFVWSIPALNARLSDGSNFVTCPHAGVCAKLCYARSGTYQFSNVKAAHLRNLEATLDNLGDWMDSVIEELRAPRFRGGKAVRIHDAGDFYSLDYLLAWCEIAVRTKDVLFYAYTKEVEMVKSIDLPDNFVVLFSKGGTQDHLIEEGDRHADVFPDLESLKAAGYMDQEASDLDAINLPTTRVGIVSNNIKHLKNRQGPKSFGELQAERDARLDKR